MDRIQYLKELHRENPDDSFVLFALAKEYEKRENRENALKFYRELYEQDPDYIGLYYHIGKLYETMEQFTEALKFYDEGIERTEAAGDQHSKSELLSAKKNLELALKDL